MSTIKISVINQCSVLTDEQVKPVVDALQVQVHDHFEPHWNIDADLLFVAKGAQPISNTWWLVLLDNSDQAGALGYHELTNQGLPIGKVFAKTDIDNNLEWSVTASHELLEMLSDPNINLTTFIQTGIATGTLYAYENCDPVEDDQYGYMIGNVKVSDFVLPCYFNPSIPANGRWDFCRHLKGPIPTMLPGGYLSMFQVGGVNSGWTQINMQKIVENGIVPGHDRSVRFNPEARKVRRTTQDTWKVSTAK